MDIESVKRQLQEAFNRAKQERLKMKETGGEE
jgi:hypothetical protein